MLNRHLWNYNTNSLFLNFFVNINYCPITYLSLVANGDFNIDTHFWPPGEFKLNIYSFVSSIDLLSTLAEKKENISASFSQTSNTNELVSRPPDASFSRHYRKFLSDKLQHGDWLVQMFSFKACVEPACIWFGFVLHDWASLGHA